MQKILPLFIFFFSVHLAANNPKIDSLKQAAKRETAIDRKLDYYLSIGEEFFSSEVSYDSAFYYFNKVENVAIAHGLKKNEVNARTNIAMLYSKLGEPRKAIQQLLTSAEIYKALDDRESFMVTNNNIGDTYGTIDEYTNALDYFSIALKEAEANNLIEFIGYIESNIGEIYYKQGKLDKAEKYISKGISRLDSLNLPSPIPNLILSQVYRDLNKNELAENAGLRALEFAQKANRSQTSYEASLLISEILEAKEDYEGAAKYARLAIDLKEELVLTNDLSKLEKLKLQHEIEEQKTKYEAISKYNELLNTIYILIIVGILLLIFLVHRQMKVVKMTKNIHEIQNSLIKGELKHRNKKDKTIFDATVHGDKKFLKRKKS